MKVLRLLRTGRTPLRRASHGGTGVLETKHAISSNAGWDFMLTATAICWTVFGRNGTATTCSLMQSIHHNSREKHRMTPFTKVRHVTVMQLQLTHLRYLQAILGLDSPAARSIRNRPNGNPRCFSVGSNCTLLGVICRVDPDWDQLPKELLGDSISDELQSTTTRSDGKGEEIRRHLSQPFQVIWLKVMCWASFTGSNPSIGTSSI